MNAAMVPRRLVDVVALFVCLSVSSVASAKWQANQGDEAQVAAEAAISRIRDKIPRSASFFDEAYGFAILPSVTRAAVGFGGAYGRGLVVQGDQLVAATRFWQITSGIQVGVRNFSMIIFFKHKAALDDFKLQKTRFMGQAGLAVATVGVAGTPAYNDGVAIITVTRLGLMGELSISGARFTYEPARAE